MKLLVILDAVPADHVGGISKAVDTELVELAARGHEIRILTRRQKPGTAEHEVIGGIPVERMASPLRGSRLYYFHPFLTMRRSPRVIERICREWDPDIAYVHSTFFARGLARARIRAAKVFCYHAPAAEEIGIDAAGKKYGLLSPIAKLMVRAVVSAELHALRGMDATFTRSRFMLARLREWHPMADARAVSVIPIMVDTGRYCFDADERAARRRLSLPESGTLAVCVRRLVNRMGLPEVVASAKLIREQVPEFALAIAGTGYMEPKLRETIADLDLGDTVRLLGFVPEADLPSLYAAANLCIVPSVALEGFGLVSIEAMSCGRAVVATPIGGNVEVIGGFDATLVASEATPEAVADRVVTWLPRADDPDLRRRIRAHCELMYGRGPVSDQLEQLFKSAEASHAATADPPSEVGQLAELPVVSVVAPMRNEEVSIAEFLASVDAQDYPRDKLEILVVDGASTDRSVEIVEWCATRDPRIRIISNPDQWAAPGMNAGVAAASSEVIVRLDCHSRYDPSYIRNSVQLLLTTPGVGVVGGPQFAVGSTAMQQVIAAAMGNRFASGDASYRTATSARWADTVYLGAWRRATLVQVGGFNPAWRINEDYELNIRLRKAGYRVLLSPHVRSTYFPRKGIHELARQYYGYGSWRARTALAHPGYLKARQLAPPVLVASCLLSAAVCWWFHAALVLPAIYLVVLVAASAAASRQRPLDFGRYLAVFTTIHLSWGAGFLSGLVTWAPQRRRLQEQI